MCLFLFLFRAIGLVDWLLEDRLEGWGDDLLPPGLSLSPAPDIPVVRVSSCRRVIFCPPVPLPSHRPTAVDTHGRDEQPPSIKTPKIAPRGVAGGWVCGWVGSRPQQGPQESCAPVCPPITQAEGTTDHKSTSSTLCFSS